MSICHKRWKTRYMSQEKPVNLYFNQTSQFQKKKKFLNIKYVKPKRKNLSLIKLHISLRCQASYVTCLCVINLLNKIIKTKHLTHELTGKTFFLLAFQYARTHHIPSLREPKELLIFPSSLTLGAENYFFGNLFFFCHATWLTRS